MCNNIVRYVRDFKYYLLKNIYAMSIDFVQKEINRNKRYSQSFVHRIFRKKKIYFGHEMRTRPRNACQKNGIV